MKLYHATYKQLLPTIKKHGLGNNKFLKKPWGDYSFKKKSNDFVFLHSSEDDARMYAENSNLPNEYLQNVVVLEIDSAILDKSKLEVDPVLDKPEGSYIYWGIIRTGKILYEAIELKSFIKTRLKELLS